MAGKSNEDVVPEIILRIPGPWQAARDLGGDLPPGSQIRNDRLRTPEGISVELSMLPADRQFPGIFRTACCRRPLKPAENQGLDRYRANAAVVAPGGSIEAAQAMVRAGAAVVRAGGAGVFIDNSILAHSGSDWLELADHADDPAAMFYAFVNIVKSRNGLKSHGMHVFGQRDAIIDRVEDLSSLEDFLRSACAQSTEFEPSHRFADHHGRHFRVDSHPDETAFQNHPLNNPYGRWRLSRI